MQKKQAKQQLKDILENQKTIRISRLRSLLELLDYETLEKRYIEQGQKIKRQREEIKNKQEKINHLKARLAELRDVKD